MRRIECAHDCWLQLHEVAARGDFGHDTAILRVRRRLRGDFAREQIAPAREHGDSRFVARCFDGEDDRSRRIHAKKLSAKYAMGFSNKRWRSSSAIKKVSLHLEQNFSCATALLRVENRVGRLCERIHFVDFGVEHAAAREWE